jgi:TrmH RNA methyltransferase
MVEDPVELEKLCGSVHHQGVVAMIPQPEIQPLSKEIVTTWLHNRENALILDRVGNANNLGAIVRSAAFFGMKNIVIPLDEAQSSVTTSSYRVAQGGMEFVTIYSIISIPRLLRDAAGKMLRLGTAVDADIPVSMVGQLAGEKPLLVVLGNEEHGISEEVKQNCDRLVVIPSAGFAAGGDAPVESLNVAQAAAVILYECMKK